MEKIPLEIFEILVLPLGGSDFLNLRRTCKRLKFLTDQMEVMLNPSIWYRYTYNDFSLESIESLLPWMTDDKDKHEGDSALWKKIYSCLFDSKLHRDGFSLKQIYIPNVPGIREMFFAGQQLIFSSFTGKICAGLPGRSQVLPITDLRYRSEDMGPVELEYCHLKPNLFDNRVVFKPLNIGNQSSPFVCYCRDMVNAMVVKECGRHSPTLEASLSTSHMMSEVHKWLDMYVDSETYLHAWDQEYYSNGILLTTYRKTLLFCCHLTCNAMPTLIFKCSKTTLPESVLSIRMIGTLLIFLFDNHRDIQTNVIHRQQNGKIVVEDWKKLSLFEHDTALDYVIDFDIAGLAFVALTALGKVFISHLQDHTHDCLQTNLFQAFDLIPRTYGTLEKICVDINDGVTIAVHGSLNGLALCFLTKHIPR